MITNNKKTPKEMINQPLLQKPSPKKNQKNIAKKIIESFSSLSSTSLQKTVSTPFMPSTLYHLPRPFGNQDTHNQNNQNLNQHQNQKKESEKEIKVGNYLIKKTLGQGTFGKVKLGICLSNQEKVAIKILEKSRIVEKDDEIRVKREFDMLAKFNHPNVILVAEIFECNDSYYCVMEFCEGGELFNYIVKNNRLSDDEAACFYYQLINGLEYIHSLGIVHRDLKPENLLLTEEHILKIIDFGLSNYFKEDKPNQELLATPCGSPCYASPEMVSGKKYNGCKIDVWSSGIILFAMICGYLPFEDSDNKKLFKKILRCKLVFPKYVSKDAKDLMKKILVTDPEKRITISDIKKHPFYLKGKEIFEQEYSVYQLSENDVSTRSQKSLLSITKDNGGNNNGNIKDGNSSKENRGDKENKENINENTDNKKIIIEKVDNLLNNNEEKDININNANKNKKGKKKEIEIEINFNNAGEDYNLENNLRVNNNIIKKQNTQTCQNKDKEDKEKNNSKPKKTKSKEHKPANTNILKTNNFLTNNQLDMDYFNLITEYNLNSDNVDKKSSTSNNNNKNKTLNKKNQNKTKLNKDNLKNIENNSNSNSIYTPLQTEYENKSNHHQYKNTFVNTIREELLEKLGKNESNKENTNNNKNKGFPIRNNKNISHYKTKNSFSQGINFSSNNSNIIQNNNQNSIMKFKDKNKEKKEIGLTKKNTDGVLLNNSNNNKAINPNLNMNLNNYLVINGTNNKNKNNKENNNINNNLKLKTKEIKNELKRLKDMHHIKTITEQLKDIRMETPLNNKNFLTNSKFNNNNNTIKNNIHNNTLSHYDKNNYTMNNNSKEEKKTHIINKSNGNLHQVEFISGDNINKKNKSKILNETNNDNKNNNNNNDKKGNKSKISTQLILKYLQNDNDFLLENSRDHYQRLKTEVELNNIINKDDKDKEKNSNINKEKNNKEITVSQKITHNNTTTNNFSTSTSGANNNNNKILGFLNISKENQPANNNINNNTKTNREILNQGSHIYDIKKSSIIPEMKKMIKNTTNINNSNNNNSSSINDKKRNNKYLIKKPKIITEQELQDQFDPSFTQFISINNNTFNNLYNTTFTNKDLNTNNNNISNKIANNTLTEPTNLKMVKNNNTNINNSLLRNKIKKNSKDFNEIKKHLNNNKNRSNYMKSLPKEMLYDENVLRTEPNLINNNKVIMSNNNNNKKFKYNYQKLISQRVKPLNNNIRNSISIINDNINNANLIPNFNANATNNLSNINKLNSTNFSHLSNYSKFTNFNSLREFYNQNNMNNNHKSGNNNNHRYVKSFLENGGDNKNNISNINSNNNNKTFFMNNNERKLRNIRDINMSKRLTENTSKRVNSSNNNNNRTISAGKKKSFVTIRNTVINFNMFDSGVLMNSINKKPEKNKKNSFSHNNNHLLTENNGNNMTRIPIQNNLINNTKINQYNNNKYNLNLNKNKSSIINKNNRINNSNNIINTNKDNIIINNFNSFESRDSNKTHDKTFSGNVINSDNNEYLNSNDTIHKNTNTKENTNGGKNVYPSSLLVNRINPKLKNQKLNLNLNQNIEQQLINQKTILYLQKNRNINNHNKNNIMKLQQISENSSTNKNNKYVINNKKNHIYISSLEGLDKNLNNICNTNNNGHIRDYFPMTSKNKRRVNMLGNLNNQTIQQGKYGGEGNNLQQYSKQFQMNHNKIKNFYFKDLIKK